MTPIGTTCSQFGLTMTTTVTWTYSSKRSGFDRHLAPQSGWNKLRGGDAGRVWKSAHDSDRGQLGRLRQRRQSRSLHREQSQLADSKSVRGANMLFRSNGDGTFTEVDVGSPIWEASDEWDPYWIDYDNDGFLDLFIAAGAHCARGELPLPEQSSSDREHEPLAEGQPRGESLERFRHRRQGSRHREHPRQDRNATADDRVARLLWQQSGPAGPLRPGGRHECHDAAHRMALGNRPGAARMSAANQFVTVVESQGYTNATPKFTGADQQH